MYKIIFIFLVYFLNIELKVETTQNHFESRIKLYVQKEKRYRFFKVELDPINVENIDKMFIARSKILKFSFNEKSGKFISVFLFDNKPLLISGYIKTSVKMPVLLKPVSKGEIIESSNIGWINHPIEKPYKNYECNEQNIIGKKVKREMNANTPIRCSHLEDSYSIYKGEKAKIIFKNSALRITNTALAKESGKVGQTISFEVNGSSNTKKIVQARIVGIGQAEVGDI